MRLVVLGAGESGVGAAILGKAKGFDVFVSDSGEVKEEYKNVLSNHGIQFEEGKHSENMVLGADEVVKSPGIPDSVELVVKLKEKGVPVISEIEFAGRFTNAKLICITGSNGKTTTTLLTHHILQKAGLNVKLAGNMGDSLAKQVADEEDSEGLHYVLELSSFQLDGMFDFKADIAILLNITPDHLDRYDNRMQDYVNSKMRITQNQTEQDHFIYCMDDETITGELNKHEPKARTHPFSIKKKLEEGAWLEENNMIIAVNNKPIHMSIQELALQGKHNIYNSMAGGIAARILELRKEVIRESLADFQNIEHRLEYITSVYGIDFINDSKATNVNSTWYALESMDKPVIWIVGGVDKGNDYSQLLEMVKDKVKAIVCLTEKEPRKLKKVFKEAVPNLVHATSMNEAVAYSYRFGSKGDAVLLSPACASFDLFENYEERGRQFKEAVRSL